VSLADIQAVIASAKARGTGSLGKLVRRRMSHASEPEQDEAIQVAVEIIETVPIFFARARQEAEERGMKSLVDPVLERAEAYFLRPVDLIPEMTQGLAGLLDDTYLVIRMLQSLDRGPRPFLDWDLDHPAMFLRRLLGEPIARRLDQLAGEAMQEASSNLSRLWATVAQQA